MEFDGGGTRCQSSDVSRCSGGDFEGCEEVLGDTATDAGTWLKTSEDAEVRSAARVFSEREAGLVERQARAFENGVAGARVVRLANANHWVFQSNEADVLREIRGFVARIK